MTTRNLSELKSFLRSQAELADKESDEWLKSNPHGEEAAYRSGKCKAFEEVEKKLAELTA